MGRKNRYPAEIKEQAINEYLNGIKGATEIAEELSIDSSTLRSWVKKYQTYGIEVFSDKDRNKSYSKELKESAIRDYLEGAGSLKDISIKYGISSHEVLRGWIKKYNRLETIKDYDPKGEVYMTKGRKTTIEERQEIVAYCIEHDYDYKGTAERYELSYAQVYQWVKKYNELGDDGLLDKRGWSIQWICKVLKIARSSDYKWTHRVETSNEIENHELCNLILDYDELFGHILGYRRMTDWINELNSVQYNSKRIHRLMKMLGVKSVIRQKSKKYSRSTPEITAENILNRNFFAAKPNEKWLTDVTEFKIKGSSKKLYLSAIIDLYDLSVVAYHISDRNNNQLVFDTYHKAIARYPEAKPLFHSDRGFQYTIKKMIHHKVINHLGYFIYFTCLLDREQFIPSVFSYFNSDFNKP